MAFDLRHLKSFLAVAEHLHFRRAAESLHLSQPALSRQIFQLEEAVGGPLFRRDNHRVELTAAGAHLRRRGEELIANAEGILRETREASAGSLGLLSLGYTEAVMASFLPLLLRELRRRRPGLSVALHPGHSERLERDVASGRLDAALVSHPPGSPDVTCAEVASEDLGVVLPSDHPLAAGGGAVDLAQLSGEHFILFPYRDNPSLYADILQACRKEGFTPSVIEEADSRILAVNMVAAGLGVALLSANLAHYCGEGSVFRPLLHPPGIRFYLIEPARNAAPPVAEIRTILRRPYQARKARRLAR